MKIIPFVILGFIVGFIGCKKEVNPVDSGGGGFLGGGNVTMTVALVQNNQGEQLFLFKPSADVVVSEVKVQCADQQIDDTVQADGQTVYTKAEGFSVGPLNQDILQTGQQWKFTVKGKIGSSTGTAYSVSLNYTIP